MKKLAAAIFSALLLLLPLTACTKETDARAERVRDRYAAPLAYAAAAEVALAGETEDMRCTLRFDADGTETRAAAIWRFGSNCARERARITAVRSLK